MKRPPRPRSRKPHRSHTPPARSLPSRALERSAEDAICDVQIRGNFAHPFFYRKQIRSMSGKPQMGDLVRLTGDDNQPLGFALFNPKSERQVRLLHRGADFPATLWRDRLERAVKYRTEFLRLDETTNTYRVIHAEADGLSGLVVDRYDDLLSVELFSPGMLQRVEPILEILHRLCGTKHHRIRCAPNALGQEGFSILPQGSHECPDDRIVRENDVQFRVEFADAHKTGFFCDQRDNRADFARLCEGATVLDLCCYTGGFSISAAKGNTPRDVTAVDLDEEAITVARKNAQLNQVKVKWVHADAFGWMRDAIAAGKQFDRVVLDPPKLITGRKDLEDGKRKHFDLNRLAMQLVAPGGVLLTCTCSGLLSGADFFDLVCAASRQAGDPLPGQSNRSQPQRGPRGMKVFHRSGAAPDHPIAADCPETAYLDAIWCRFDE